MTSILLQRVKEATTPGWLGQVTMPTPSVAKARKELAERFGRVRDCPPIDELAIVASRLRKAADTGRLRDIARRDWRRAPWCLWLPKDGLAGHEQFRRALSQRWQDQARRSTTQTLIGVYFREFRPGDPAFDELAGLLRTQVRQREWAWAERDQQWGLFDPGRAPIAVAKAIADATTGPAEVLDAVGLVADLRESLFVQSVYQQVFQLVEGKLRSTTGGVTAAALTKLLDWAIPEKNRFRFPGSEKVTAVAVLGPWQHKAPQDSHREVIQSALMKGLGDPRLSVVNRRWLAVPDECKAVMLRWLVGESLEQFLSVVDEVAKPSHWSYRRAFWGAYYRAGAIDAAWVAFAHAGHRVAARSFEGRGGFALLTAGVESRHAVLLLRIGELTIADWSHNGTCRIWVANNRAAPALYKPHYTRLDLVNGEDFSQVHMGAENGRWQDSVSAYIAQMTGIRVTPQKYMPKRR